MSSVPDPMPWHRVYTEGVSTPEDWGTAFASWQSSVKNHPDSACVIDSDRVYTWAEIDERSDAVASWILDRGIRPGSRVGIYLQNDVEWVVSLLATWKTSCIAVALNPMFKERELNYHLVDSGATLLVVLDNLLPVAAKASEGTQVQHMLIVGQGGPTRLPNGSDRFASVWERPVDAGSPTSVPGKDDVAILTYTSGTTGTPKGAMNTQGNLAYSASIGAMWYDIGPSDVILGVAPLFHITGLVLHIALSWRSGAPLVLLHRFDPNEAILASERNGATFTVGSITVFSALLDRGNLDRSAAPTLQKLASGGAPIAAATLDRFEAATGRYIHNVYGMTETTSPSHAVPLGRKAPVAENGAVSVGVPVPGANARILDFESDTEMPPGEIGEIVIEGPMVVPGYWQRPQETEDTMPGGVLRTGDVGLVDEDGWFYVVDRAKDVINASGFKVWPREVEDVLYEHPDVRETIVVGVPDDYRGETVKAFVVLSPNSKAEPDDLIAFTRERLAAYKYPRSVVVCDELPKTPTGKYLRRAMKDK